MKAKDLCLDIFDGTHDSPSPNSQGKHLLINSKNINNGTVDLNNAYYISDDDYKKIVKRSGVQKNDILISMIGTIGNVCLVEDEHPTYAIKNMGVFRGKTYDETLRLYYYLQTPDFKAKSNNFLNSSIQKFLTLDFLRNLDIPDELFYKIDVNKLYHIDQKIKANISIINVLTNKIKDIFTYWFIDCYAEKRFNDDNEFKQVSLTNNDMCSLISTGIKRFNGYKTYFSTSEVLGNDYSNFTQKITYDKRESRANMEPKEFSVWFAKMKKVLSIFGLARTHIYKIKSFFLLVLLGLNVHHFHTHTYGQ